MNPNNTPKIFVARPPHPRRRRAIGIVLLLFLVAAAAGVAYLITADIDDGPSAFRTDAPAQKPSRKYCSRVGTALTCQDIRTGEQHKYALPSYVGFADRIVPSPDERFYFIETTANPLPTKVDHSKHGPAQSVATKRLFVADATFKSIRELPAKEGSRYVDVDWTADGASLIYAEKADEAKVAVIYVLDVVSGRRRTLADTIDVATLFVTADGKKLIVSDRQSSEEGRLGLTVIDLASGNRQPLATGGLSDKLRYYANHTYDRVHDRLYVVGNDDGGPLLVVAKPVDSSGLSVAVERVIDDGYAYTPLTAVDGGMFVARRQDQKQEYGTIGTDFAFSAAKTKPTQQSRFGIHEPPAVPEVKPAAGKASDYVYGYVALPDELRGYLSGLASKDCSADTFNEVALLAHDPDAKQFAVQATGCKGGTTLQYHVGDGAGGYRIALENVSMPSCGDVARNNLSKVIAPVCSSF